MASPASGPREPIRPQLVPALPPPSPAPGGVWRLRHRAAYLPPVLATSFPAASSCLLPSSSLLQLLPSCSSHLLRLVRASSALLVLSAPGHSSRRVPPHRCAVCDTSCALCAVLRGGSGPRLVLLAVASHLLSSSLSSSRDTSCASCAELRGGLGPRSSRRPCRFPPPPDRSPRNTGFHVSSPRGISPCALAACPHHVLSPRAIPRVLAACPSYVPPPRAPSTCPRHVSSPRAPSVTRAAPPALSSVVASAHTPLAALAASSSA